MKLPPALAHTAAAFTLAATFWAACAPAQAFMDELYTEDAALAARLREGFKASLPQAGTKTEAACPKPPMAKAAWVLLVSDRPEDNKQFLHKLGAHLGLAGAFDFNNEYHRALHYAHNDMVQLRDALSEAPLLRQRLANALMERAAQAIARERAFWPPELKERTPEDITRAWIMKPQERAAISRALAPRAQLRLSMYACLAHICKAEAQERASCSDMFERYYNPHVAPVAQPRPPKPL